jgi:integrase
MLVNTKTKEDRCVPMMPKVEAVLNPHRKGFGRVFPDWHKDTTSKWFHAAALSCGIKARLHDLRHSAITYMLHSGINIHVVMEIVGHKNLSTTMIYTHVETGVMAREMAKMKIE